MTQRFWNDQKYCECQLVTLWNVAIYYEIDVPTQYGLEYVMECARARAIHGGAIHNHHLVSKLGLNATKGQLTWKWIKSNCPIEFSIFCHRGYHSVLMVDVNTVKKKVLLTNYARGRSYWIGIDNLIKMHNKRINPIKWRIMSQKEIAIQLALGSLSHKLKCGIAGRTDTSKAILGILAKDESKYVKWAAAQNPNTPQKALITLSTNRFNSIREMVASNPSTPPKTLSHMADNDRNQCISQRAIENLWCRGHRTVPQI